MLLRPRWLLALGGSRSTALQLHHRRPSFFYPPAPTYRPLPQRSLVATLYHGTRVRTLVSTMATSPDEEKLLTEMRSRIAQVEHLWDDRNVLDLLQTYITGDSTVVMKPLLPLMSAAVDGITWIPYYMEHVLASIRNRAEIHPELRASVAHLVHIMTTWEDNTYGRGDTWEPLFVMAVLIRLVTRIHHDLLNVDASFVNCCSVSYNELWQGSRPLREAKSLEDLLAGLQVPPSYPHLAIYHPPRPNFPIYDLITVAYEGPELHQKTVTGYQLKFVREVPQQPPTGCTQAYLIRRVPADQQANVHGSNWVIVSPELVDDFIGKTAATLTPPEWREPMD